MMDLFLYSGQIGKIEMRVSETKSLIDQCARLAQRLYDKTGNNFQKADLDHIISILESISRELVIWDSELYAEMVANERFGHPRHLKAE